MKQRMASRPVREARRNHEAENGSKTSARSTAESLKHSSYGVHNTLEQGLQRSVSFGCTESRRHYEEVDLACPPKTWCNPVEQESNWSPK